MTVKELKEKLKKYDDDLEIYIQEEYNSSGGISKLDHIFIPNYDKKILVLDK